MSLSRFLLRATAAIALISSALAVRPAIVSQPSTYRTFTGEMIRLSLVTQNEITATRWQKDGVTLVGQTSTILSIPNATAADEGSYVARLSNRDGSTSSTAITVKVSPDRQPLEPWKVQLPQTLPFQITSLIHEDGRFIAGTAGGTIHLSEDGEHWTQARVDPYPVRLGPMLHPIRALVAHQGRYYAFTIPYQLDPASGGWVSDNLTDWIFVPGLPQATQALSNGESVMIRATPAVPTDSELKISSDMVTWTPVSPLMPPVAVNTLTSFQGKFLVQLGYGATARLFQTVNGKSWTDLSASLPPNFNADWQSASLAQFKGELVHIQDGRIWHSADAIIWTEVVVNPMTNGTNPFQGRGTQPYLSALGRLWFFDANYYLTSENLSDWEIRPWASSFVNARIAVGTDEVLVASINPAGVALTRSVTTGPVVPAPVELNGVANLGALRTLDEALYVPNNRFGPALVTDLDGVWKKTNTEVRLLAKGNGIYAGRDGSGYRLTSYDGRTWNRLSPYSFGSEGLKFGNGRFVDLAGDFESFMTSWSTDGRTWSTRQRVPTTARILDFEDGRFWAIEQSWATNGVTYSYRLASSTDGESWKIQNIPLAGRPGNWYASDIISFGGRMILNTGDASWWLVSDDHGETWKRLDTGYGFLGTTTSAVAVHDGWLVVSCVSGDMLLSPNGADFFRIDGPGGGGDLAEWQGALYMIYGYPSGGNYTTSLGIVRSGDTPPPIRWRVFGIEDGQVPELGHPLDLGVVMEDWHAGDRIEIRLNDQLVHSSDRFYTSYRWLLDGPSQEMLIVTVLRADGTQSSRSWKAGGAPPMQAYTQPAELPSNGRTAFQSRSGDSFYRIGTDGVLHRSQDLLHWTDETLPDIPADHSFVYGGVAVVTLPNGARLASHGELTWASAAGGGPWVRGRDFTGARNGQQPIYLALGGVFHVLQPENVSVLVKVENGTEYYAYVFTYHLWNSADGLNWTALGDLPSTADLSSVATDGNTALLLEGSGYHADTQSYVDRRLWRYTGGRGFELLPWQEGLLPNSVSYVGGMWFVQSSVGFFPKWLRSTDLVNWTDLTGPEGSFFYQAEEFGNGLWIVRTSNGIYSTPDFSQWTLLSNAPGIPMWIGDHWVNRTDPGSIAVEHFESTDLVTWRYLSAVWPTQDSTVLTVTGDRLVSTLGKGLFAMDGKGDWILISSRRGITAAIFWQGRWVYAAERAVGISEGGVESWAPSFDAPPVTDPNNTNEVCLGFSDAGDRLLMFSNRSLYITADGRTWTRRPPPEGRGFKSLFGQGQKLIVETIGAGYASKLFLSDDLGASWRNAGDLPTTSASYSWDTQYGLYQDAGGTYFIPDYNHRYRSTDGGQTWSLLPFDTRVAIPAPVALPNGLLVEARNSAWSFFENQSGVTTELSPQTFGQTAPERFHGRLVALSKDGLKVTPLANLTPSFPAQAGHSRKAGESFSVTVEVRNTGIDRAWLETPVAIDVSLSGDDTADGGEVLLGSLSLSGGIEVDEIVSRNLTLAIPASVAGGRYHLVARLRQTGGLPVDATPGDDVAVSSEALLKVTGGTIRVAGSGGGQVMLLQNGAGTLLAFGARVERSASTFLRAVPAAGQRFVGWSDPALGAMNEVSTDRTQASELTALFSGGALAYEQWAAKPGPAEGDADADGSPNLIEFLLASDPLDATDRGWRMEVTDGRYVEFRERQGVAGSVLGIALSGDLSAWEMVPRERWIRVAQDGDAITWRVSFPDTARGFFRFSSMESP